MSNSSEFPLATDALQKGDIVSIETIETAFMVKRGTKAYSLAALRASEYIKRRLEERGQIVTIEIRKESVCILTDEEAVAFNRASVRAGARKMRRAHERQIGSDRALMTEGTRSAHDRDVEVTGRVLGAMKQEYRRQMTATPTVRNTPLLPDKSAKETQ